MPVIPHNPNKPTIYRGGTFDTNLGRGFRRSGAEMVKKDLLNHLFTRRGERVMMPDFGTSIQDMVFDPNDEITRRLITDEIQSVIDQDPRVELIRMTVSADEDNHRIDVEVVLRFIELEVIDIINLDLESL
jgi:phage baseplate assembly protein W